MSGVTKIRKRFLLEKESFVSAQKIRLRKRLTVKLLKPVLTLVRENGAIVNDIQNVSKKLENVGVIKTQITIKNTISALVLLNISVDINGLGNMARRRLLS